MTDLLTRLEPRTRSDDLTPGLAARLWDVAWSLAQQWVYGEFDGQAGSRLRSGRFVMISTLSR